MALPPRERRHLFLRYEGLQYSNTDIVDFESRLARIYWREVHRVQVFDFRGLSDFMAEGLSARMLMEHRDAQGVSLSTSLSWRRLFDIRGPLVHELILEFFSTFRFGHAILDLDTPEALQLCHRLIACSIARRSQIPKKVTVTNLFYLRGMDVNLVNVPYLLARYLRLFAPGRKSGAHISGGQFVARLAEHFGLLTAEILRGLIIYEQLDDTWAWVAMGPERQPDAAAGAPRRMARLEEDVHEIRGMLAEQREVISAMAQDFSRFCTWTTTSLARMMDRAGVTYTSYSETPREYTRRVRRMTREASTYTAQQDPRQPDP
ncbi:hypothetical protein Tco_0622918 [Tanacetum coccineum]